LLNSLQFHDVTLAWSMCVGGGQGMAMISSGS